MDVKNLFANVTDAHRAEEFLTLFENANAKIERIVSHAHASPSGFWYDQEDDEWVTVCGARQLWNLPTERKWN